MGNSISASLTKKFRLSLIFLAFVLTLSACSQDSADNPSESLSAPIPEALRAVALSTELVIEVMVDNQAPVACNDLNVEAASFNCKLSLPGGEYTLSLIYSIKGTQFGTVKVAETIGIRALVVIGKDTAANFSQATLNFDVDGDGIDSIVELNEGSNPTVPSFYIDGTVSGLLGSGTVVQLNGTTSIDLSNNNFTFKPAVSENTDYSVIIATQPSNPDQTCTVSNGAAGTITEAITVAVTCSDTVFTLGGDVSGMAGSSGLVLSNGGENLTIGGNGAYTFNNPLADGSPYIVTVLTQPSNPKRTCSVANDSGNISANVTNVDVTCVDPTYSVSGTINNLLGGGLELQNNGGDDLTVTGNTFIFSSSLVDFSTYDVTVLTDPSNPNQICTVSNGASSINGADITNVVIDCVTVPYTISGTITGLAGSGLVLKNNTESLTVTGTSFTFSTAIDDGQTYAVSVQTNPADPAQTCTVTNGAGTVNGTDISNVAVTCSASSFTLGGAVNGLVGSGMILQYNDSNNLTIDNGGTFTFAPPLADGSNYTVTVFKQPDTPTQSCAVTTGSTGTINGAEDTSVVITCDAPTYTVSTTVTGLNGSGLVLQNNLGDNLTISAIGSFTFATPLVDTAPYSVTVSSQPGNPSQTCSVTNSSGAINAANVTNVAIACVTSTFTIGGKVSTLNGTGLILQNSLGNNLPISANGNFTFTTALDDGSPYSVTVLQQPSSPNQTCTVTGGSGNLSGSNISNVQVKCNTTTYTIGGTISGLAGTGLALSNNGGNQLPISQDGGFTFTAALPDAADYVVTVRSQPSNLNQTCSVLNGTGTVNGAIITNVAITCVTKTYTIGGTVSGLAAGGSLVLQNNLGDNLPINANGGYTFTTALTDGSPYSVSVLSQAGPAQTCSVTNGSNNLAGSNVINVNITCSTLSFAVGGMISGLAGGTSVTLLNNGADSFTTSANGNFTFNTPVADGSSYLVSVQTQPSGPNQICSITNGSGTINGAVVTTVAVACSKVSYKIGGTVIGLAGSGMVLQNNLANDLTVNGNTFTFNNALPDGSPYSVTVLTPPGLPSQTCTVNAGTGSGNLSGADITTVGITCVTATFKIGGNVTGLAAGNSLVLQNNGAANLQTISGDGVYSFTVNDGSTNTITVNSQPSAPNQTCTVSAGVSRTISNANITNVDVACVTTTYKIGGTISGLVGAGLQLLNGAENLPISADTNGPFAFVNKVADGNNYAVTVAASPTNQTCTVTGATGSGTVNGADITTVDVACVTNVVTFTIGGNVTSLVNMGLRLQNNLAEILAVPNNGVFTFTTPLANLSLYDVQIISQPAPQTCNITRNTGTLAGANVTNILVTCSCVLGSSLIGSCILQ